MGKSAEAYSIIYDEIDYSQGNNGISLAIEQSSSAGEVLLRCLNKFGVVDIEWMSTVSGISVERLISELRGKAIFQDPEAFTSCVNWSPVKHWYFAPAYLQGNIPQKYKAAIKMNEKFHGCFDSNVKSLKAMLPVKVTSEYIHPALGATWLPASFYASFIKQLLNLPIAPQVEYIKELCEWKVRIPYCSGNTPENMNIYGTFPLDSSSDAEEDVSNLTGLQIIAGNMNGKLAEVHYSYSSGRSHEKHYKKTVEAQEKQKLVCARFDEWLHERPAREAIVTECYNKEFVGYAVSAFDGSFLELPKLCKDIKLYPHQLNAVARILFSSNNLLLAHDVGTGKTYEMIVSAHELHRMGLSHKNLIVVPNNVLRATVDAHHKLYPDDEILAVYPTDFTPKKRCKALNTLRDKEYVCAYMAYSSFDMVVMSKDYWIKKKQADINALQRSLACAGSAFAEHAIRSEIESKKKALSGYAVEAKDPDWPCFDDLGIETLYVDEAHNYKNISITTRTRDIIGMRKNGSKKCREMLEKVHFVKRAIFATGTPLTNSLSDLYVLQTYLQPDLLKFKKIDSFDAWVQTFSQKESNYEVDVTSSAITPVVRFSSFHNLPELMAMFSTICDFHNATSEGLPVLNGPHDICVAKSPEQVDYLKKLVERAEDVHAHLVSRKDDNLLKITTDGRKCALDDRLVRNSGYYSWLYSASHHGKVEACADKAFELYQAYPKTCQVIFSDIGTPHDGFNIYDSLKYALIDKGVPSSEIAFVHDAVSERARAKLFESVNSANTRIIIGSTPKLGMGVNIQQKLIALHHLSVPWRPSDMTQREGRLLRQGNTCPEVFIFRYITEGTFDSYSWQLLENKQRFISSFLSGFSCQRDCEDISDTVLNYAEVKALAIGDPLIKKRVETTNRIERARIASSQRQKTLMQLRSIVEEVPYTIDSLKLSKSIAGADYSLYRACRERIPKKERKAFGEELIVAIRNNGMADREKVFDHYQGFDVILPMNMTCDHPYIIIRSLNGGNYHIDMDGDKALGCTQRIDNLLDGLLDRCADIDKQIAAQRRKRRAAEAEYAIGNPHKDEIEVLLKELRRIDEAIADKKEDKK